MKSSLKPLSLHLFISLNPNSSPLVDHDISNLGCVVLLNNAHNYGSGNMVSHIRSALSAVAPTCIRSTLPTIHPTHVPLLWIVDIPVPAFHLAPGYFWFVDRPTSVYYEADDYESRRGQRQDQYNLRLVHGEKSG
jgi:hypothetical protein